MRTSILLLSCSLALGVACGQGFTPAPPPSASVPAPAAAVPAVPAVQAELTLDVLELI